MRGKCKFCGEMKDEGRWLVMRETSKSGKCPRTTFVSNVQISSVSARNQKKIFECAKCVEEKASTLKKNLNILSKEPLDSSIFSIVEEVGEIKKNTEEQKKDIASLKEDRDRTSNLEKFQESIKKLSEESLQKRKNDYLDKKYEWYKPLIEEQKEKIRKAKNEVQLDQIVDEIKKNHNKIKEGIENNIFHFNTPKHIIGWISFIPLFSAGIYYANKERKKERKITSPLEDIEDKFKKWRLNMVLSLAFYVLFFIGVKQFINRFVRSWIDELLEKWAFIIVGVVSILLGGLFVLDGFITSSLKTPLQRLGVKIESTPIDEKIKGKLLSKTQKANEVLKENFKRFGLLALPAIVTGLLGKKWDEQTIAYLCYLIPVFYATVDVLQVGKVIKKVRKN